MAEKPRFHGRLHLLWAGMGLLLVPGVGGASDDVTFAKDVAPILQQKCQTCHRPGTVAPMSLLTYEDTRPWARAIKYRVSQRIMPPWPLDKTIGIQEFKNDRIRGRQPCRRQEGGDRRHPVGFATSWSSPVDHVVGHDHR